MVFPRFMYNDRSDRIAPASSTVLVFDYQIDLCLFCFDVPLVHGQHRGPWSRALP
jgi:hypothetical protein